MPGTGDFEESKHPRAPDGKFGSGSGEHERTESSLKDPAFVREHMNRLMGAADRARGAFPVAEQNGDEAHGVAQAAIHREASLIHHEDDAASGEHADRLQGALKEARESGMGHEAIMDHLAAAHESAGEEQASIAAGHVNPDHEVLAPVREYLAARAAAHDALAAADTEGLVKATDHAADAMAAFKATDNALEEHAPETHKPYEGEVQEDLESSAQALDSSHEGHDHLPDKHSTPDVRTPESDLADEAPQREDFDHEHEFNAALAEHAKATAEHADHAADLKALTAEHKTRAGHAQDALEALHEKQHGALEALKESNKSLDRLKGKATKALDKLDDSGASELVNHDAFAAHAHGVDGEGDKQFHDEGVQAHFDRAQSTAQAIVERHTANVNDDENEPADQTDAIDAIKEAAKSTASAIRHMSKITGRPAKIAGAKAKKSNRPGAASAASVASMARYKLKLSKLDFVSLVDQPAQATATCRLIKRKGVVKRVQTKAVARLLKVADGPNPLAYFWAFTCTDETGQPYHDLQGDAIEPEAYIKAAEDFMSSGAAVDEMHDSQQTGRVAFAFPMDGDIAKAMFGASVGEQIKTSGLMIAMRPTADQVAKLRSGELAGVSIAGNGIRQLAKGLPPFLADKGKKKPKRYGKSITLTSETDGHAHTVDLDAPADNCWSDMLSTSSQTAEGATETHSHAWVYDATTGAITIAADSGHTHTVDAVVSPETMAEAAEDDDDDEDDDAVPCAVEDEPSSGKTIVVAVAARAPVSTPSSAVPTVKAQEQSMATPEEKIADLEKRNARLEKMSTLTDAQRAHLGKLNGSEAESFLAKSAHEREVVLNDIEKANEVVYTSPIDGGVYRKNDDRRLIEMAKRADDAEAGRRKSDIEKRETEFAKRGDEVLKHFPQGTKKNLRARMMKAVNAEFSDPAEYDEAVQALKGHDEAVRMLGVPHGTVGAGDGDPNASGAQKRLDLKVAEFAKANNLPIELAMARATASDPEIRKLYNEAQAGN